MTVLLLDHDGLGTYTIAQYLGEMSAETEVYHPHQLSLDDITDLDPSHIVLSPSAGAIKDAIALIQHFGAKKPILGVGLGFIAVIQAFDGIISPAPSLHAGQVLAIQHAGDGLFNGLPSPLTGVSYQHQSVLLDNMPKKLDVTAWSQSPTDDTTIILAVKHQTWPLHALLFHPEAMLSEHGHTLLKHFLA